VPTRDQQLAEVCTPSTWRLGVDLLQTCANCKRSQQSTEQYSAQCSTAHTHTRIRVCTLSQPPTWNGNFPGEFGLAGYSCGSVHLLRSYESSHDRPKLFISCFNSYVFLNIIPPCLPWTTLCLIPSTTIAVQKKSEFTVTDKCSDHTIHSAEQQAATYDSTVQLNTKNQL